MKKEQPLSNKQKISLLALFFVPKPMLQISPMQPLKFPFSPPQRIVSQATKKERHLWTQTTFLVWNLMPPPLPPGVKNVKIQVNSGKIREPLGVP